MRDYEVLGIIGVGCLIVGGVLAAALKMVGFLALFIPAFIFISWADARYPKKEPPALSEIRNKIQQASEALHSFNQEGTAILEIMKTRNEIAEKGRIAEEQARRVREEYLKSLEKRDCGPDCKTCTKKDNCELQKKIDVVDFIMQKDGEIALQLYSNTGIEPSSTDSRLGVSFDDILMGLRIDSNILENVLKQLLEEGQIRKLPNGKYAQL